MGFGVSCWGAHSSTRLNHTPACCLCYGARMSNVSRMCVWAAMARAFGAREPDSRVRNPDFLAERLLGPEERALLGNHPLVEGMNRPYPEASQNLEVMMGARTLIPRTRFIDARLEAAIREGTVQIVILGAGFDSRAYRLTQLLTGARVFEVDQPDTQVRKIQRVQEVLGNAPSNLQYVAVDFRQD